MKTYSSRAIVMLISQVNSMNGFSKKILIDDDSAISESIQVILEGEGYHVAVHSEAGGIYDRIQVELSDLIVLDLWLPGEEDGGSIANNLKKNLSTKTIPIVMISASNNAEYVARTMGADDFLPKPFDIDDLLLKIHQNLPS